MISIFPDLERLSQAASELIAQHASAAAKKRGRFTIALAGGHTPRRTYELLAAPPLRDRVPWPHVHVFWGDERCVPPDDERSNQRMARAALLDHVPIPPAQIHPIECAGSPAEGADRYEQCLRDVLGPEPDFNLVLLGLGENAHTASLFPHSSVLAERARWVGHVYLPDQKLHRITLTAPAINRARTVLFLVSGADKAPALRDVLHGEPDPERLPAQLIRPLAGDLRWFVDEAAARQLIRTEAQTRAPDGAASS